MRGSRANGMSPSLARRCVLARLRRRVYRNAIIPLAGLALGLRLPGDQDFAAGRDITWGEAVGAGGKELVEARLQDRTEPAFEVGPQIPPTPLLSRKSRDGIGDCRVTTRGRRERHSRLRQNPDVGQDAQLPAHVY